MAYAFNGSSQYISNETPPINDTAEIATYSCLFNSASESAAQILIATSTYGSVYEVRWLAARGDVANNPVQSLVRGNSTGNDVNTTTGYTINTWHHAGAVWSSTTSRSVYIDGGSSASDTLPVVSNSQNRLLLGAISRVLVQFFLSGLMSEAAIWNVALTNAEIASLAKGFSPRRVRPQSLVFYAPLLRNLQDLRQGLALTAVNSPTVANHPRVY